MFLPSPTGRCWRGTPSSDHCGIGCPRPGNRFARPQSREVRQEERFCTFLARENQQPRRDLNRGRRGWQVLDCGLSESDLILKYELASIGNFISVIVEHGPVLIIKGDLAVVSF